MSECEPNFIPLSVCVLLCVCVCTHVIIETCGIFLDNWTNIFIWIFSMIAYFSQAYGIKKNTMYFVLNNVRIISSKYLFFFLKIIRYKYFMHRIEHVKFQFVRTRQEITMTCRNFLSNYVYLCGEHVGFI